MSSTLILARASSGAWGRGERERSRKRVEREAQISVSSNTVMWKFEQGSWKFEQGFPLYLCRALHVLINNWCGTSSCWNHVRAHKVEDESCMHTFSMR